VRYWYCGGQARPNAAPTHITWRQRKDRCHILEKARRVFRGKQGGRVYPQVLALRREPLRDDSGAPGS
jgi:hypothetical protein